MNGNMFCGELELAYFLGSILEVLIPYAFGAAVSKSPSSTYDLHISPSGIHVLDFNCPVDHYTAKFLKKGFDLVSSENHKVVDFISTKDNPLFGINKAAVELFKNIYNNLEEIESKVRDRRLIVTGQSLGGYLAILFTLWLHHVIDEKRKSGSKTTIRPICITFGSPLFGDKALESAISERPEWKSSFLSVVSTKDPLACLFSSDTLYKPFGTFLFYDPSGGHTAFKDQEAIMAVLDTMRGSDTHSSRELYDYKNKLSSITRNVLYRGVCDLDDEFNSDALKAGIALQFKEVGVLDKISKDLIKNLMEVNLATMKKSLDTYSEEKKLNKRKIKMASMELFISSCRSRCGYYDCYKSGSIGRDEYSGHQETIVNHRILNQYWEEFVKEKELKPQKEDANLRKRWLYSGNNYRRMFEPIYIAEYYKKGNIKYIENRPNHYKLLEQWWNEDRNTLHPSERKNKGPNINDDSCFWARVEEALISLRILTTGNSSTNVEKVERKLDKFMVYVMGSIKDYTLSSDVFLEGSSLMKWWSDYNTYKKGLCPSEFAQYMKSGRYKLYQ